MRKVFAGVYSEGNPIATNRAELEKARRQRLRRSPIATRRPREVDFVADPLGGIEVPGRPAGHGERMPVLPGVRLQVARRLLEHMETFHLLGVAGTTKLIGPGWGYAGPPHVFGQIAHEDQNGLLASIYSVRPRPRASHRQEAPRFTLEAAAEWYAEAATR